ncbi:MAG: ROK family protein [Planctomycetes bacterium]|nr:ROK family protein [Planctomycetota bacterium]
MSDPLEIITRSDAQGPFFVGLDLGGTNIKVGVLDDRGRTLARHRVKTLIERGPEDAAERMGGAVREAARLAELELSDVARVGLGSPGTMDIPAGMLLGPVNLPGWENFPIRDRVAHYCGLPVTFTNDANAAAYGEYWVGTGSQFPSIVLLTLGTGVGGGIILGDFSIEGENSAGAEIGHLIIDYNDDARVCSCGKTGHLEAYCSATAVVKRTRDALAGAATSSLRGRIDAGEELTPLMIAQEAAAGDALSDEIVIETARLLGIGVSAMMYIIDPAAVILGGAMTFGGNDSDLGRRFLERIREEVRARAFPVPAKNCVIDYASLGGAAGYIGAAGIARVAFQKEK